MLRQILLGAAIAVLAGCSGVHDDARKFVIGAADNIAPEAPDGAIRAVPMPAVMLDADKTLTRIIFASCAQQNEDQSIWDQLAAENPDLMLYVGDNVYGDVWFDDPSLPALKAAYMRLAQSEPFARARAAAPMLTVWDDHDYGASDGGGDYPYKAQSEALFEYVWALPEGDPRRARPGVYGSWVIGAEEGRQVQIIMLDTRYFRSPLKKTDERGAKGKERYVPDPDPSKTMLGDAQWAWLEAELKKPADLRLLVSSVQVIADGHGWEGWKMLPADRDRLYGLIDETDADNLIILSGDRHSASLYRKEGVVDYPLFEATSSSLNLPASKWRAESGETWVEPGPNRISQMYYDVNYGVIDINWEKRAVDVAIHNGAGETVMNETVVLAHAQ